MLIGIFTLYLFSLVQTPAQYIAVSFLVGIGMSSVTILPNQVLVSRWFHDRVGLVNGIVLAATALGAAIAPPLITRIIEASAWRTAFTWMGLAELGPPTGGAADGPAAANLIQEDLATGEKQGYRFTLTASPGGYVINAAPLVFGTNGSRTFWSDQTMTVRQHYGQEPATASSEMMK